MISNLSTPHHRPSKPKIATSKRSCLFRLEDLLDSRDLVLEALHFIRPTVVTLAFQISSGLVQPFSVGQRFLSSLPTLFRLVYHSEYE